MVTFKEEVVINVNQRQRIDINLFRFFQSWQLLLMLAVVLLRREYHFGYI